MKCFLFIATLLLLSACGNVGGLNVSQYSDVGATPQKFILCHGYGCSHKTVTNFTETEWRNIKKIFKQKFNSAEIERQKISMAIALMEKYTGDRVGTKDDLPKAPIFRKSVNELDCIDETLNTTKYLNFLNNAGLLKFYEVGKPVYKGFMLNGVYPHNSASIKEIKTGDVYVVDSYIFANGEEPNIRLFENWRKYRIEELENADNLNRATVENLIP